MRILLAGHTAPGGVFTVGSHHLARALAAQGHDVAHLSSPVSALHLGRVRDAEVRRRLRLSLRTHEASPGVPGVLPFTLLPLSLGPVHTGPLALRTSVPSVRRRLRPLGMDAVDVLLVDQPLVGGLEELVRARAVVYRSTDVYEEPARRAGEARVLRAAHGLVATSAFVLERLQRARPDLPSLVLDNGVDFARFAGAAAPAERRGLVYVGAVDDRFCWDSLRSVAVAAGDEPVDVYGPVQVAVPDGLPANVRLHGQVSYGCTPALLRGARVGLLPFRTTAVNRGRSPMKLFEYLAAGLPVLSTLPPSVSPWPPGVHVLPEDGGDVTDLVRDVLGAGVNEAGVEAARAMDWAGRARTLVEHLDRVLATRPAVPR